MSGIRYQFEGPFDSSYSLAILNREMARAVEALRPGSVALYSTEGPGDYAPNLEWLRDDPQVVELWRRSQQPPAKPPDVTLRNLYPPRVTGMSGQLHVMNTYGWEETGFPAEYVAAFNEHLHLVTVMSSWVRKVLVENGVRVPVVPVGVGVDHILRYPVEPVSLPKGKRFCFLHISSCFPRKGVDVLLDAYTAAFTAADDVLLVIKTFPNPHSTIEQQLLELWDRQPDCPAIHLIDEDLSIGQINSLYQQADALVAPSRGEGFGMPMAEAMLWGTPVITTGYGGHTDFCTPETSWLIDYHFAKAQTHMGQFDSLWVEPDTLHLTALMRKLYALSQDAAGRETICIRTQAAKAMIENGWCWSQVAGRLLEAIDGLYASVGNFLPTKLRAQQQDATVGKVAWVSTWNTRCGIASYSEWLLENSHLPVTILANADSVPTGADGDNVIRCWETRAGKRETPSLAGLLHTILNSGFRAVVIQFNFAFFGVQPLQEVIKTLRERGIVVYLFFHATQDVVQDGRLVSTVRGLGGALADCTRLLAHGTADVNRLKRFGRVGNVTLIPHGVMYAPDILARHQPDPAVFRIASYGFLLPDKGVPELISAFALLQQRLLALAAAGKPCPQVRLELFNALYPGSVSEQERTKCVTLIEYSGYADSIGLHTAYQENEQSLAALAACDLVVFPYQKSRESSSAAVRMGLAAGRPVACTPMNVFGDVADIVHFLPGVSPQAMAEGLLELVMDSAKLASARRRHQQWLQAHAWEQVTQRLDAMLMQDMR
ncbi:glycosyltransferase [Candidatus Thiothrix sp. Deng01]|uniref:Glycosyltransferase n=1 Tax=Candidatus Thiothrix phosphatis TaxID=3112415 RepID=A0ABU6CXD4_9GAMM|nr:glycosyltransferase [Candidatus Thiothrix sp. Deng01]MEB4590752.1 glycosyltransferase [Candidatus Thiothrix sp. Deng01]